MAVQNFRVGGRLCSDIQAGAAVDNAGKRPRQDHARKVASPQALAIAAENARRHNVADRVRFLHGDLMSPLGEDDIFDIIAANPPYISEREWSSIQADVRLHEPAVALLGGPDGLDVLRRLIADAPRHLAPGGRLLVEISPEQAGPVHELFEAEPRYGCTRTLKDLAGRPRVVQAERVPESA